MTYLDELCRFLAGCRFEDLPQDVVRQAGLVVADTVAAIAAGSAEPEMAALTARLAAAPGPAAVIGTGLRTEAGKAALLNGTAGTFLEMDEGNRFSRGHPAIHILPAVLAVAETEGMSGRDAVLAFVLGYEVGARLGGAARLRAAMHPHGTWGTVAAAVAVAKLAGADADRFRETLNVASSLTLATSKRTMLEGGTVRNVYAGVSNQMGLLARDLVEAGFSGERDGVASVFGAVVSDSLDTDALVRGLGGTWQIAQNYFKLHSCCRYNHATLDALAKLGPIRPDEVAAVEIETYGYAAELDDPRPRNTLAAKFSVPFAVATTIAHGSSGLASFTMDAVRDPKVLELAGRVSVREDPALSARLPAERPARVTVRYRDGREARAETFTNRGDDVDPYTPTELAEKYRELAGRVWPAERAAGLHERLLALHEVADVATLFR
jgi:2-methylcitrate dehydratase PrpD